MTAKKQPAKKAKRPTLKQLEQQVAELSEDLMRSQADFTNFRRRSEEENTRAAEIGKEFVITALLPVIDNIERALANVPADIADNSYIKGLGSVAKQLDDTLIGLGLHKIETVDHDFDPERMEAVSYDDGDGEREVVIEELQSGYELNGTVIRHAMVKVGKK